MVYLGARNKGISRGSSKGKDSLVLRLHGGECKEREKYQRKAPLEVEAGTGYKKPYWRSFNRARKSENEWGNEERWGQLRGDYGFNTDNRGNEVRYDDHKQKQEEEKGKGNKRAPYFRRRHSLAEQDD